METERLRERRNGDAKYGEIIKSNPAVMAGFYISENLDWLFRIVEKVCNDVTYLFQIRTLQIQYNQSTYSFWWLEPKP